MENTIDFDRLQKLVKVRYDAKNALEMLNEEKGFLGITVERKYDFPTDGEVTYYSDIELDPSKAQPFPILTGAINDFKERLKRHYEITANHAEMQILEIFDGQAPTHF